MSKFEGERVNLYSSVTLQDNALKEAILDEHVRQGQMKEAEQFALLQGDEKTIGTYATKMVAAGRVEEVRDLLPTVRNVDSALGIVEALNAQGQQQAAHDFINQFFQKFDYPAYLHANLSGWKSAEQNQAVRDRVKRLVVDGRAPEAILHIAKQFESEKKNRNFNEDAEMAPFWDSLADMNLTHHALLEFLQSQDQSGYNAVVKHYYEVSAAKKMPQNLEKLAWVLEKVHGREEAIKKYPAVYASRIALLAEQAKIADFKQMESSQRIEKLRGMYDATKSPVHIYLASTLLSKQEWNRFLQNYPPDQQEKMMMLADWYGARRSIDTKDTGQMTERAAERAAAALEQGDNEVLQRSLGTLLSLRTPEVSARLTKLLGQHLERGGEVSATYQLCRTLSKMDSFKANTVLADLVREEYTPEILSRYLIRLLVENGHFDENLRPYFQEKLVEEKEKGSDYPKRGVQRFRTIMQAMGINPDAAVMRYMENRDAEEIKSGIEGVNKETDNFVRQDAYEDQAEWLLGDVNKRLLYFFSKGGRSTFSLINDYSFSKFTNVLNIGSKLEVHPDPLKNLHGSLSERHGTEIADDMLEKIRRGQFPFTQAGHEAVWKIAVDANRESEVEQARLLIGTCLGKNELGKLAQAIMYRQVLDAQPQNERRQTLEKAWTEAGENFASLDNFINTCRQAYESETSASAPPKILSKAAVAELPIHLALEHDVIDVSPAKFEDGLQAIGNKAAAEIRHDFKNKKIDKVERDRRLAPITNPENVLPAILAQELPGHFAPVLEEWKSHISGALQASREARLAKKSSSGTRELQLRFLDKTESLPEYLRLADSAQCCFTSKNFNESRGPQEYIARIWKDPLSFVYHIEEPTEHEDKRTSIGFVFGSYGINRKNEPVLLLNGVYMDRKTDLAARKIIGSIEQHHAKPLGATEILVASLHGGATQYGKEYGKTDGEYMRLRAIRDRYGEGPETHAYDDIGLIAVDAKENDPRDSQAFNRWARTGQHIFRRVVER